jgi:hypothetical protein
MLNNPAPMLYRNINQRLKKDADVNAVKPKMRGLLAQSENKMKTKPDKDRIDQPMQRVASYVAMLREQRESVE